MSYFDDGCQISDGGTQELRWLCYLITDERWKKVEKEVAGSTETQI